MQRILSKLHTVNKLIAHYKIKKGYYVKKGEKRFAVVMYHGIDLHGSEKYNQRFFSKDDFEKQVALFSRHMNVLSHEDFVNNNFSDTKQNLVITFDDGYLNNLKYAVPVLEKYNAHAYFFITGLNTTTPPVLWADAVDIVTKHAKEKSKISVGGIDFELVNNQFTNRDNGQNIETFIRNSKSAGATEKIAILEQLLSLYDFTRQRELDDYWQLMNDAQISEVAQSKSITVGSHGFFHNNLGSLLHNDAVAEVSNSRNYLENLTQKKISTIAYPDGSYTCALNESLFGLGFTKQFLVNYRFSDDGQKEYVYDRVGLYPYIGNPHKVLHTIIH